MARDDGALDLCSQSATGGGWASLEDRTARGLSDRFHEPCQGRSSRRQPTLVGLAERRHGMDEGVDPPGRGSAHHLLSLAGRRNLDRAGRVRVRSAHCQSEVAQAVHDPSHRRPGDVLRLGEPAQCARTAEHENRQGTQPSRGQASLAVHLAHASEQVDRAGVERSRGLDRIREMPLATAHRLCIACLPFDRYATRVVTMG